MLDIKNIRKDYTLLELDEKNINKDPVKQFSEWMNAALKAEVPDATAMILSTVSKQNRPSSRVVLLKEFSDKGFDFYTNYLSKKGQHLDHNPYASLLFFWPQLERQVRIEGAISKVTREESEAYFETRPVQSQMGAWASPQSKPIPNRETLIDWYEEIESINKQTVMRCPPHWGGYRLKPDLFEFWQGRENRLHDRIEYRLEEDSWVIRRLAP